MHRVSAIALSVVLALEARAAAQDAQDAQDDEEELGVTAEVPRPMARAGGDDPSASATEIDATERPTALDTLADAVLEAPGARALRSGGFGSPTTLSLRGSEADQVEILFGDVPLTTADGSPFDLSSIPLWVLDRVEVYRGGAPSWLARSGIGGVLRLVPREAGRGPALGAAGGLGAYGLAHGRAMHAGAHGDAAWLVAAGATSTQSDFPYTASVTLLDGADEVERRRENAWLSEGAGLGHLTLRLGDGVLSALVLGRGRQGGVPGRAVQPALHTRRADGEGLAGVSYAMSEGGRADDVAAWRLALSVAAGVRRRTLSDPLAEIGLVPVEADDLAARATVRVAAAGRALDWLELIGAALYVHESLWPTDRLARTPNQDSARDEGNLALEARAFGALDGVRAELRPSARLALVGARLSDLRPDHLGAPAASSITLAPTFRLGGALEPARGVTIAASVASATRVPNQVELFGDRGFLVGVATLAPERAETIDLGLVLAGQSGALRGRAELRGFVTFASDLIRYRRNTLYQAVPENVASATLAGAELGARVELERHFTLVTAWTLLGTWTEHLGRERQLPLRPWLTGYARPEVRALGVGPLDVLGAFVDVEHVSETSWDPANTSALAARTRFGVGVTLAVWDGRLRVDAVVRDVFDQRGFDLLGFPLPGRTLAIDMVLAAH
ncbi:MAG: TonB-dependent receptor [Sandaracinaceae bacterium]|nr:TonB-dependent receptor [Sandaracinaceae bacterium]